MIFLTSSRRIELTTAGWNVRQIDIFDSTFFRPSFYPFAFNHRSRQTDLSAAARRCLWTGRSTTSAPWAITRPTTPPPSWASYWALWPRWWLAPAWRWWWWCTLGRRNKVRTMSGKKHHRSSKYTNKPSSLLVSFHMAAEIENRLSTMLYQHRTTSSADFSPTGDYRRGESLTNPVKLNCTSYDACFAQPLTHVYYIIITITFRLWSDSLVWGFVSEKTEEQNIFLFFFFTISTPANWDIFNPKIRNWN